MADKTGTAEKWDREKFDREVLRKGCLAAVGFYNDTDVLCRGFLGELDSLAGRMSDKLVFGKINVNQEEALAEKYAIRSVPTFMVFCEGRGVCEMVGESDGERMMDVIDSAMNRVGYADRQTP